MEQKETFFSILSERERKRLISFSKSGERRKEGERRYIYTYLSNIYRFVGVTGSIIISSIVVVVVLVVLKQ